MDNIQAFCVEIMFDLINDGVDEDEAIIKSLALEEALRNLYKMLY